MLLCCTEETSESGGAGGGHTAKTCMTNKAWVWKAAILIFRAARMLPQAAVPDLCHEHQGVEC